MRQHQGLEQWPCQYCGKGYKTLAALQMHITVKHADETGERPEFICGIDDCGKKYTLKVRQDIDIWNLTSNWT